MKPDRWIVRLEAANVSPAGAGCLLSEARRALHGTKGTAANLRVSRTALEMDVYLPPGSAIEPAGDRLAALGRVVTLRRLVEPAPRPAEAIFFEARGFWNEERFWEVHESLEGFWKTAPSPEKEWTQGIILAAAALVHWQKNEPEPIAALLEKAAERLSRAPADLHGWPLTDFLGALRASVSVGNGDVLPLMGIRV